MTVAELLELVAELLNGERAGVLPRVPGRRGARTEIVAERAFAARGGPA